MGRQKHLAKIDELFKKSPVVSFQSIKKIIGNKNYSKRIINSLLSKDKIKKLTKGHYSLHDNPELLVYCFSPAYLGLQDSLSSHELWEQETIPIIITARKIRPGIRQTLGTNVLIKRIDKKHFFGIEEIKQGKYYLPYSDIEKTLIDLTYYNENITKETLKEIKKKINKKKLKNYLKEYDEKMKNKVLRIIKQ